MLYMYFHMYQYIIFVYSSYFEEERDRRRPARRARNLLLSSLDADGLREAIFADFGLTEH